VAPPSGVDEIEVVAALTQELRLSVPPTAPRAFAALVQNRPAFAGLQWSALSGRAPLPERIRRLAPATPPWPALVTAPPAPPNYAPDGAVAPAAHDGNGAGPRAEPAMFRLVASRSLFSGPAVEATPELAHQREGWVQLSYLDAVRLGVTDGDTVTVRHAAGEHRGRVRTSRRLREGTVRINWRGAPAGSGAQVVAQVAARA
jgi:anaerobic selenocysteine-containing dehydrogenase